MLLAFWVWGSAGGGGADSRQISRARSIVPCWVRNDEAVIGEGGAGGFPTMKSFGWIAACRQLALRLPSRAWALLHAVFGPQRVACGPNPNRASRFNFGGLNGFTTGPRRITKHTSIRVCLVRCLTCHIYLIFLSKVSSLIQTTNIRQSMTQFATTQIVPLSFSLWHYLTAGYSCIFFTFFCHADPDISSKIKRENHNRWRRRQSRPCPLVQFLAKSGPGTVPVPSTSTHGSSVTPAPTATLSR